MTLTPSSAGFAFWASTGTFGVNVATGCRWSVAAKPSWVLVLSGAEGTGDGAVSYYVQALPYGSATRTGTMTINGTAFTVAQSGSTTAAVAVAAPPPAAVPSATPAPTAPLPTAPTPSPTSAPAPSGLCNVSFTPNESRFTWLGGYGQITISAPSSCSWSVSSRPSWVTLYGGTSGTGNRSILYRVPLLLGASSDRSEAVVVNGRSFLVHQSR